MILKEKRSTIKYLMTIKLNLEIDFVYVSGMAVVMTAGQQQSWVNLTEILACVAAMKYQYFMLIR